MKKIVIVVPGNPSQCPHCQEYFDFYENQNSDGEWRRATQLKQCPYCNEKIRWPSGARQTT